MEFERRLLDSKEDVRTYYQRCRDHLAALVDLSTLTAQENEAAKIVQAALQGLISVKLAMPK